MRSIKTKQGQNFGAEFKARLALEASVISCWRSGQIEVIYWLHVSFP
jgi:hypothetical protein